MANEIILPPPPTYLQNYMPGAPINKDLTDNVGESFPVLSIRSGKFFIRFQGVEKPYLDASGRYQSPTIDVVLLRSNPVLTKAWYIKGYQSGDRDAPDCFSTDGKAPDPDAPNTPIDPRTGMRMQFCSVCPNNIFGSAPKNAEGQGGRGKACADSRRVALMIPPHALDGEIVPVLMRVPPTSLKPLAEYGALLERARYPYHAVMTRLSFATVDAKGQPVGYPMLKFEMLAPLPEHDFNFVEKLRAEPVVERMLYAKVDGVNADAPRPELAGTFERQAEQYAEVIAPRMAEPAPMPAQTAPGVVGTLADGRLVMSDGTFRDPVPPAAPEPTVVGTLADGRTVMSDGTFREPEKPKVDKTGWVPIQGQPGLYFSPQAGGLVNEDGEAPSPNQTTTPAPQSSASMVAAAVAAAKQEQAQVVPLREAPTPEQAATKARVARPRKTEAKAAPLAEGGAYPPGPGEGPNVQENPPLETRPNGGEKAVIPSPAGMDSILAGLKNSGVDPS